MDEVLKVYLEERCIHPVIGLQMALSTFNDISIELYLLQQCFDFKIMDYHWQFKHILGK
jgi:hypothetical protein